MDQYSASRRIVTDVEAPECLATIVATIGPASQSPEMVRRLIEAGVGVFRFNFSHGDFDTHLQRLRTVRQVAREMRVEVACLGDLQGPKIRVGKVPAGLGQPSPSGGGMVDVRAGQEVVLKADLSEAMLRPARGASDGSTELVLPLTYQRLVREVQPGHKVLINDGAVRMLATERGEGELRCVVTVGGWISSGKGINVPQSELTAPAITDRDWECVAWAVQHDMDYLAMSFVRRADEIIELKERLSQMCPAVKPGREASYGVWIPVIAKIEMPQAVKNLESIIEAADAVMVARGDLGVEMDIARVPVVQKQIVQACRARGKPCIVATQMLETMIENATPTRAEASDVANAVFDGADAVMLSAETAVGKHPVLVVETMARVLAAAEDHLRDADTHSAAPVIYDESHRTTAALAEAAATIVAELGASCVACWSERGGTARYLSQNRFHVPILAYSSDPQQTRRMALYRGVIPICCPPPGEGSLSAWNLAVDEHVRARKLAKRGEYVVLVAGRPLGKARASNTLAIYRVGEPAGGYLRGG